MSVVEPLWSVAYVEGSFDMAERKSVGWGFRLIVVLSGLIGLALTTLLFEIVLGLELPRFVAYALGFALGIGASVYFQRNKILKDSDPNSTEVRARHTARLISDSHRD